MTTVLSLAVLAGLLSVLSPCVLPILPIVAGAARGAGPWGPAALAAGLAAAFALAGSLLAAVSHSLGFDAEAARPIAGATLTLIGAVIVVPPLARVFERLAQPLADRANAMAARTGEGVLGQFGLGALLGVAWSPCVGPTLGAASLLAAQGRNLGEASLTMLAFGLGAALPLAAMGYGARRWAVAGRKGMAVAGKGGKLVLGWALLGVGLLVLTGLDKVIESIIVGLSPAWLTALTTRV
jgi:cytochrome c biogenesis protein CcdA